jgi:acetone carboxylase gamma subunit
MITIRSAWNWLGKTWCSVAHPSPLWPIHGTYRCPTCFRMFEVEWEASLHRPVRSRQATENRVTVAARVASFAQEG